MNIQERDDYIIKSYKDGKSTNIIGDELNINPGTAWHVLKKNNISIKKRKKFKGNIEDFKDEIISLYKSDKSAYRISKDLNISLPTICRVLHSHGLNISKNLKHDPNNLLKNKLDEVIELYNKGHTCNDIGRILGHGGHHIMQLLKKSGYEIKDFRYQVDEKFFEKIDTAHKAYILGWFYSDGNVRRDGKIRIQIQEKDSYILGKIAKIMKYSGPLHDVPPPKRFPWRKSQKVLCINRKVLASQLIRLGCSPNKSLTLRFPDSNMVPKHLLPHFVLGYFDGDGSVRLRGNNLAVGFTSTDIFLKEFDRRVLTPMRIESKMYYRHENTNSATLFIQKQQYIKPIFDYMYQDSTIHLTRKYNKFKIVLK